MSKAWKRSHTSISISHTWGGGGGGVSLASWLATHQFPKTNSTEKECFSDLRWCWCFPFKRGAFSRSTTLKGSRNKMVETYIKNTILGYYSQHYNSYRVSAERLLQLRKGCKYRWKTLAMSTYAKLKIQKGTWSFLSIGDRESH